MTLLLKLLLAHFLADFVLQGERWLKDKQDKAFRSTALILHSVVHGLLYFAVLSFDLKYWLGVLVLSVSHYLIDGTKCLIAKSVPDPDHATLNPRTLFLVDQFLHIALIYCVTDYYAAITWQLPQPGVDIWLLALSLLLLTRVSSIVVKVLISRWAPQERDGKNVSLANAGSFIGVLERLFVFTFVITNHWEAIGFLLAAKSVFRFGDLKEAHDRVMTEYVLIGTLLSFGFAIAIGMAFLAIYD